jgi:hypothetical protein
MKYTQTATLLIVTLTAGLIAGLMFGYACSVMPGHLVEKLADGRADEADPQHALDAAAGRDRSVDAFADLLVGGAQVVVKAAADRSQRDPAAGPFEQRGSDPALQLLDRLTDPGGGHVQPLGGAAEMQLLGEGQEDLDVALLHHRSSHS